MKRKRRPKYCTCSCRKCNARPWNHGCSNPTCNGPKKWGSTSDPPVKP